MAKLFYEHVCRECGADIESSDRLFECPNCRSENIQAFPMIVCDCGETLPASGFTNECPECGALYNAFGQRLADPETWDPDDRYDSFGPQNEEPR